VVGSHVFSSLSEQALVDDLTLAWGPAEESPARPPFKVGVIETATLQPSSSLSELLAVDLSEQASVEVWVAVGESVAVQEDPASTLAVTVTVSEALALGLGEVGDLVATNLEGATAQEGADPLPVGLSESASVVAQVLGSDAVGVCEPVPFARDSFTDANGTALADHVPEVGAGWVVTGLYGGSNPHVIQDNQLEVDGNDEDWTLLGSPPTPDYQVSATVRDEYLGVIARGVKIGIGHVHGYAAFTGGFGGSGRWMIARFSEVGYSTTVAMGPATMLLPSESVPRVITLRVRDATVTLLVDGQFVCEYVDPDPFVSAEQPGIYSNWQWGVFDDFSAEPEGIERAEVEASLLDLSVYEPAWIPIRLTERVVLQKSSLVLEAGGIGLSEQASVVVQVLGVDAVGVREPVPFAWDSFTDANGTNILSHTPEQGGAWTKLDIEGVDTGIIQSNALTFDGSGHSVFRMGTPESADYEVCIRVASGDTSPIVRAVGSDFYYAGLPWDRWTLFRQVGTESVVLAQGPPTEVTNDVTVTLRVCGTRLDLWVDGQWICGCTDAELGTAGQGGLDAPWSRGPCDDYRAAPLGLERVEVLTSPLLLTTSIGATRCSVSLTERVFVQVSATVADGVGVRTGEALALAVSVVSADALAIGENELAGSELAGLGQADITASDSLTIQVSPEGAAAVIGYVAPISVEASDPLAVGGGALAFGVGTAAAADGLGLAAADAAAGQGTGSAIDGVVLGIAEVDDLRVSTVMTEVARAAVTESAFVTVLSADVVVTVSDATRMAVSEAMAIQATVLVTDGVAVQDAEGATGAGSASARDAGRIAAAEGGTLRADLAAGETLRAALSEVASVVVPYAFVTQEVADSAALGLSEAVTGAGSGSQQDAVTPRVGEATALRVEVAAGDGCGIRTAEVASWAATFAAVGISAVDALGLGVVDAAFGVGTVSVADAVAVQDAEVSALETTVWTVEVSASDSVGIRDTDDQRGLGSVDSSDPLRVMLSDVAVGVGAGSQQDTTGVRLSERAVLQVACDAADAGAIQDTETASLTSYELFGVQASAPAAVAISETPALRVSVAVREPDPGLLLEESGGSLLTEGGDPLGLDGGFLHLTEAASVAIYGRTTKQASAPMTVDLTEAVALHVRVDASDGLRVTETEDRAAAGTASATESAGVRVSERALLSAMLAVSDSPRVAEGDQTGLFARVEATDGVPATGTESGSGQGTGTAVDLSALRMTEAGAVRVVLDASDAGWVVATETGVAGDVSQQHDVLGSETVGVQSQEAVALHGDLVAGDPLAVGDQEAPAGDGALTALQALSLGLSEQASAQDISPFASLDVTEPLAVVLLAETWIAVEADGTDSGAVRLGERAAVDAGVSEVMQTVREGLPLAFAESASVLVLVHPVEAAAVRTGEEAGIVVALTVEDAARIGATELVALLSTLGVWDAAVLVTGEAVSGEGAVSAADDLLSGVGDRGLVFVPVDVATETLGVGLADLGILLSAISASEVTAVAVVEGGSDLLATVGAHGTSRMETGAGWNRFERDEDWRPTAATKRRSWWQ
jgi:hypothetical protein